MTEKERNKNLVNFFFLNNNVKIIKHLNELKTIKLLVFLISKAVPNIENFCLQSEQMLVVSYQLPKWNPIEIENQHCSI